MRRHSRNNNDVNKTPNSKSNCDQFKKGKGTMSNGKRNKGNNQRYGKGNKPNFNFDNKEKSANGNSGINDIAWYSRNPELLAAAARIPFPYKPGMIFNAGTITGIGDMKFRLPGVCQIKFAYSCGLSEDITSPASIAAKEMYGRIRSKFSGALDADAPDIFMYAMALDSIHAYIAWMKRLYKVVNLYSPNNRDYPSRIAKVMNVDPAKLDVFQSNKPQFWGYINTLVNMANKFTVPDDMDLYHRHRWMNENVYMDAPSPAGQSYVFNPIMFYIVDTTGETGTKLISKSMPTWFNSPEEVYQFGKSLIDALSEWDDAYTINGYMLRAYEGTQFYTSSLIAQEELLTPVYELEVLTQIQNCTAIGFIDNTSLTITQDPTTNIILHTPKTTGTYDYTVDNVINMPVDTPTAADVTIASRLTSFVEPTTKIIHGGTEIVSMINYTIETNRGVDYLGGYGYLKVIDITDVTNWNAQNIDDQFSPFMIARSFNYSPNQWIVIKAGQYQVPFFTGDIHNITLLPNAALDELNRVCIYSEFNCFR